MNFCYKFPVVKGIQAGKEYYIAMVPLKILSRLFPEENEFVLPEYRAQRRINELRIPIIKNYILDNKDSYVFSALAASIDGDFEFIPEGNVGLGILEISLDARFLINDGQHRKAAIAEAINESPEIGEETISIVFYQDQGLKKSQQMFTDLNKHAVKTSNSIAELYDSRDGLAVVTRKVVENVAFFDDFVDKEKDILGKFSSSLFTLNTIYTSNKRILGKKECNTEFEKFCILYWQNIAQNMLPWTELQNKELSKKELREQYLAVQSVIIQAFGRLGNYFYNNTKLNMDKILVNLKEINWKRSADIWFLRVVKENGRIINNEKAIILATNMIKKKIDLSLTEYEKKAEEELLCYLKNRG